MSLETEFERVSLPLENPFTISRGTQTEAENVVVRITDDAGMTGVGGAAPSAHYGETADTVAAVMPDLLDAVERVGDP
ncbi:dipeptide epimerase, partial [Halorubrum sp. E3]